MTGPFQSDALVVPHKCQFDHIHDKDQCNKFDYWADVAKKSCSDLHQMDTDSFAMLLPCGTDMFTGVEFVCCPAGLSPLSLLVNVKLNLIMENIGSYSKSLQANKLIVMLFSMSTYHCLPSNL